MPNVPRVVVVIPTLNEASYIEDVIGEIVTGDPIAETCPVVVADGGSTDGTREIVMRLKETYSNLRLLNNPARIQAEALNLMLGPEHAEAEVLIRCDAHAKYPPRYVSRLVACLQETGAASVVVPMDARARDSCFQRGLAWVADTWLGAGGSRHRGGVRSGWIEHGHHAAFRMPVFRALKGYDTEFAANEDAEYDRRLVAAGYRIWLESNIRIDYFPRDNPVALWRQYFRYGRGRAQTCLKHNIVPAIRQMIPVLHVLLLGAVLLALPATSLGLVYPAIYLAAIAAAGIFLAFRQCSICGLAAIPALAIVHASWGLGFLAEAFGGRRRRPEASSVTT